MGGVDGLGGEALVCSSVGRGGKTDSRIEKSVRRDINTAHWLSDRATADTKAAREETLGKQKEKKRRQQERSCVWPAVKFHTFLSFFPLRFGAMANHPKTHLRFVGRRFFEKD